MVGQVTALKNIASGRTFFMIRILYINFLRFIGKSMVCENYFPFFVQKTRQKVLHMLLVGRMDDTEEEMSTNV